MEGLNGSDRSQLASCQVVHSYMSKALRAETGKSASQVVQAQTARWTPTGWLGGCWQFYVLSTSKLISKRVVIVIVRTHDDFYSAAPLGNQVGWLLEFNVVATSKVISERATTCDSVHS